MSWNQRPHHVFGESGKRSVRHGTACKRVLQDAEVDTGATRFRAQLRDLPHFQTAVLGQHDRLSLRHLRADVIR